MHLKIIVFIQSSYDKNDEKGFSVFIQKPDNINWLQTGFFLSHALIKVKDIILKKEDKQ